MKIEGNGKDQSGRVVSAAAMTGSPVSGLMGEDLGKVEEIMLDGDSGRVVCAVLSFGGFLGLGDRLFAVPWAALRMNRSRDGFILNADRSVLEGAPGFDRANWPDFSDASWSRGIHAHYGAKA
jgi:uncharacterized protein YrrD